MKLYRSLSYLSAPQVKSFNDNGFLVLQNLISPYELAKIKLRAHEHIDHWDPKTHSVFTTEGQNHLSDQYFMDSSYNISFFLEESASIPLTNKFSEINKIGHALHDIDPVFRKFSYRAEYKSLLHDLGLKVPKIVQSMYIVKSAKYGGKMKAHQDSSYLITEPQSCIGIWVALEDANPNNSCMYAVPGSHKLGPQLYWEKIKGKMVYSNEFEYDCSNPVCLEATAGTVILLHGSLVHWSGPNVSDVSRSAYTLHIVEGELEWSEKNWIQRPSYFPFSNWKNN